jgi:hypothetical protein
MDRTGTPEKPNMRRRDVDQIMVCLAMALVPWLVPGRAEAQWGFGIGWGAPAFNSVPSPTDYLNQRALVAASRASGPASNSVYADSPNAYYNKIRDNSDALGGHYDYETRRSASEARIARSARASATAAPAKGVTTPRPVVPIISFFNRDEVLVWPADAPINDELGPKRATSDNASLAVLHEYNRLGLASIATATEARNNLLGYGRPALKFVRDHSTVRLSDTFHLFLLSLYESLEQATKDRKPVGS